MEGQVSRLGAADVEVLVEPPVGRDQSAAFLPGRHYFFFAFLPQDRVAFTRGNDYDPAGSVAMGLFVELGGEDGHMRGHFRAGELDVDAVATRSPGFVAI